MLGRGILANIGLMNEIKCNTYIDKELLKNFHDEILNQYVELFNDDKNALFKMKELWSYMIHIFSDNKKYAKKIKKSQKLTEYNEAVISLFTEQEIVKGAGLFSNYN
jgi:tRNA-dihydrouridine synthase